MTTPKVQLIKDARPELRKAIEAGLENSEIVESNETYSEIATNILKQIDPLLAPTEVPQEAAGETDEDCSDETLTPRDLERMAEGKKRFLAASAPATDEAIAREAAEEVDQLVRQGWRRADCPDFSDEALDVILRALTRARQVETPKALTRMEAFDSAEDYERGITKASKSTPSPSQDTEDGEIAKEAAVIARVASDTDGSYQLTFDAAKVAMSRLCVSRPTPEAEDKDRLDWLDANIGYLELKPGREGTIRQHIDASRKL